MHGFGHTRVFDRRLACGLLVLALLAMPACAQNPGSATAACSLSVETIFERKAPAVVSIATIALNPARSDNRLVRGGGSGFVLDRSGESVLILTNAHVVQQAQAMVIGYYDGSEALGEAIGMDPVLDVALLQAPVPDGTRVSVIEFGASTYARPGSPVVAIGSPLGLSHSVSAGIVSAVDRILPTIPFTLSEPYIQTDTPINPGNSGGPLLDRCGRLVGMNTAIVSGANSIGFAIPSALIERVVPMLIEHGEVRRPWIGFHGRFIDATLDRMLAIRLEPGFLVELVEAGSPAEQAGLGGGQIDISINGNGFLVGGDVILEFNGVSATDPERFLEAVMSTSIDDRVQLRVSRHGERRRIEYRAESRPTLPTDLLRFGADAETAARSADR